jgi:hypothetical protein
LPCDGEISTYIQLKKKTQDKRDGALKKKLTFHERTCHLQEIEETNSKKKHKQSNDESKLNIASDLWMNNIP